MSYTLVIVESPTKVSSIGKYLNKLGKYKIASSMGHIRDLPSNKLNIDIENQFQPNYELKPDKKKIISELKKLSKEASEVIMASDEDREGEAIAWHICHAINLDPKTTKRITFNEITETAIEAAIKNPRIINQDLVDAQQARRILDRIVGYQLSPLLWVKVSKGLSAGRVQSIAVRLIYEREEEIKNFKPKISTNLIATFKIENQEITANLKNKLTDLNKGKACLEACRKVFKTDDGFQIVDQTNTVGFKKPPAPFKTSTLQQEASQRLGFNIKKTMISAQKLYEAGHITYLRTDSLSLSTQALDDAKTFILKEYGEQYYQLNQYTSNTKSAQEAHEAIRPTNFAVTEISDLDSSSQSLYKLIHQRTVASQMSQAELDKTNLIIAVKDSDYQFTVQGQKLKFNGFLAIYKDFSKDIILPNCKVGDKVNLIEANTFEKNSQAPARYSEASLVKHLEELGIGRPSTYAPIINNILEREYVVKGDVEHKTRMYKGYLLQESQIKEYTSEENWGGATNKLIPTSLAELVIPFLKEYFSEIMNYQFTSNIETELDQIATGQLNWVNQLQKFYDKFNPTLEKAKQISKKDVVKMREIGLDPSDNQPIYARMGRFGPYLQKGNHEESNQKPLSAPMPSDSTITMDNITLDQALKMFQLPRTIGSTEFGENIIAKSGPFGPYIEINNLKISLGKDYDPFTIDLNQTLKLIEEKKIDQQNKVAVDFGDIKIHRGPYGFYLTDGKKNGKIPKDFQSKIDEITEDQAQTWFQETAKAPRKGRKKTK